MKQLTSESALTRLSSGFGLPVHRPESRRRVQGLLRPEASPVALDLEQWEIMADLDPGMIDWERTFQR